MPYLTQGYEPVEAPIAAPSHGYPQVLEARSFKPSPRAQSLNLPLTLTFAVERWPIAGSFAISRGAKTEAVVLVAELADGKERGRGECVPYARYGETVASVSAAIEAMRPLSLIHISEPTRQEE